MSEVRVVIAAHQAQSGHELRQLLEGEGYAVTAEVANGAKVLPAAAEHWGSASLLNVASRVPITRLPCRRPSSYVCAHLLPGRITRIKPLGRHAARSVADSCRPWCDWKRVSREGG